jgi:FKBP-type peptidyl-prolyl cis-trans isomerase SlpA
MTDTTDNNKTEILANSKVTLHFSLALTDGTEAITTFEDEPMTISMGDGNFMPGMEMAIYGLKKGDEQTITLTPEQAYGFPEQQLVHEMPLADFGDDMQPEAGQVIAFSLPNGEETPGMILEVNDETARVDFNHPLAGHEVVFKVKILKIDQPGFDI